ncbi:MAG: hypothetical protein JW730_08810 [Anaerolineales bacterium]|nr:hypothetical protein [Anaerolineales bacterium]
MKLKFFFFWLMAALLAACSAGQVTTPTLPAPTMTAPTLPQPAVDAAPQPVRPTPTIPAPTAAPTSIPLDATDWKSWSVIPALSPEMLDIYKSGQALQRDPHVVSVVGDCESSSDWFLKDFSKDERFYDLGPYASLQETIDHFKASLGYRSYAALRGATAPTVLSPLWADPQACEQNETPLACEYRVHNPSFAFIALGTNDIHKVDQFEPNMRLILEYTLQQGIVPILVTKADNLEGDDRINNTIARLAVEYHLPVWNFWAAVQPLPGHGLQGDGAHLTFTSNFFNDPENLKGAWAIRNLTALQVLEAMRTAVQEK